METTSTAGSIPQDPATPAAASESTAAKPDTATPKPDAIVKPPTEMPFPLVLGLAFYFFALAAVLMYAIIRLGWGDLSGGMPEVRLIVIILAAGALGALVQSISSFVWYAGERSLYVSWAWWYAMRPLIGAGLALIFYFALRGGFMIVSTSNALMSAENVNPFGVAALGGIIGMFSKEATDKLKEIAGAIFREQPRGDEAPGMQAERQGEAQASATPAAATKPSASDKPG